MTSQKKLSENLLWITLYQEVTSLIQKVTREEQIISEHENSWDLFSCVRRKKQSMFIRFLSHIVPGDQ